MTSVPSMRRPLHRLIAFRVAALVALVLFRETAAERRWCGVGAGRPPSALPASRLEKKGVRVVKDTQVFPVPGAMGSELSEKGPPKFEPLVSPDKC